MKRLFEENTICRLCLRVDEKAYKINNANHKTFIESIIKLNKIQYVLPDDLYVCYICKALLTKFFNFAQTVWKAQEMIGVLLKTRDKISKPMLDHIDRRNNGLNCVTLSSVVTHENKSINNSGDANDNGDDNDSADDNNFQINKPMLDRIDRHNSGLSPIILSSVITYRNKTINNSGDDNDSSDDNGHTSTDIEEANSIDIVEVVSTDIEEVESTDIEEIDLDIIVDKMKKNTKKEQERKKKKQKLNSSSDENEDTYTLNLDEEEVEINKIGKETNDIFVDSFFVDARHNLSKTCTTQKPKKLIMREKIRKTTERIYSIEAKNASSTTNQKECKNKSDGINEDYRHDSTSISTANENKCKKENDEIIEDYRHDSPISSTANENKCKKENDEINEDYRHDSPISFTANDKKRKKKSVEIDEDYSSDSTSSSTANVKKHKKRHEVDKDYFPDSTSHSEDSDYDSYDDEGKPIRRPKDTRVYPMKCDHCDFMVPEKRDHYRHYQNYHLDVEYPYKPKEYVSCMVCGKLVSRVKIRVHEEAHLTQNFKCSLCPKIFPNKVRLYRHRSNVHPKKTFTCDYCSKVFKTKIDFRRHIRTHTGSKPYKCHICEAAFAHSGNRIIHIRVNHQNYKDKPKKQKPKKQKPKPQKKRRKNTQYSTNKEVYDTSDDEPLVRVATNPQIISKTSSEESNVKPKMKCKKQGPIIQNGIEESKGKS